MTYKTDGLPLFLSGGMRYNKKESAWQDICLLVTCNDGRFPMKHVWQKVILLALTVLCFAVPAWAAGLTVKSSSNQEDVVNVAVPYISGSRGGDKVDLAVNREIFNTVDSQLEALLKPEDLAAFQASHGKGDSLSSLLAYHKDLVKFTSKEVAQANSEVKTAASWYVRSEYEIKSASPRYLSYIQKTTTYLGGAHDNVVWTAGNYDLSTGNPVTLDDLFATDADYQSRLTTLIGWQQAGVARLKAHVTGHTPTPVQAVTVTGAEKFYVDKERNLGIFYNPGEIAPMSEGVVLYDLSLNDFADLIRL
jgi:hypothetical protein